MSNQFGFLSDDTFAEKMDTMNQFLAAIATGQGNLHLGVMCRHLFVRDWQARYLRWEIS